MAKKSAQCTDHMNLGNDKGGNATGGSSSAMDRTSPAFRSGRDADNDDYKMALPMTQRRR